MSSENSYSFGNCTWFVAQQLSWIPPGLGDAYQWLDNAKAKGFNTSSVPVVGSVVVYGRGGGYSTFGHVAIVTDVSNFRGTGGTFGVKEMNFSGFDQVDTRNSTTADVLGFILPPGTADPNQTFGNLPQDAASALQGAVNSAVQSALAPIGQQIEQAGRNWLNEILYGAEVIFGGVLTLVSVAILILTALGSSQGQQVQRTARNILPAQIKKRLKPAGKPKRPTKAARPAQKPATAAQKPTTGQKPATAKRSTGTPPKPRRRKVSVMGTRKEQRARMMAALHRNEERLRREHANYDYSQIPF